MLYLIEKSSPTGLCLCQSDNETTLVFNQGTSTFLRGRLWACAISQRRHAKASFNADVKVRISEDPSCLQAFIVGQTLSKSRMKCRWSSASSLERPNNTHQNLRMTSQANLGTCSTTKSDKHLRKASIKDPYQSATILYYYYLKLTLNLLIPSAPLHYKGPSGTQHFPQK